jgi:hypothetical protein
MRWIRTLAAHVRIEYFAAGPSELDIFILHKAVLSRSQLEVQTLVVLNRTKILQPIIWKYCIKFRSWKLVLSLGEYYFQIQTTRDL